MLPSAVNAKITSVAPHLVYDVIAIINYFSGQHIAISPVCARVFVCPDNNF